MKKVILASIMMLFCLGAFAQRGDVTPEDRAKRQTQRLTEQLSLNADQEKQVLALNLDRVKKMEEARAAGNATSNNREAFQAAQEEYTKKLNAILTAEQQEKYKKMQEEMRQRGGRQNGPRGGQGAGEGRPQN